MTATCARCDQPSALCVNGIETCAEHANVTLDFVVDVMAVERGMPVDAARRALAKLLREALGDGD